MMKNAVCAISFFQSETRRGFFMGIVNAAMKKNVSYNIKLLVESHGEVQNSLCDCPAGDGPHATCKHVVATLLVISHFVKSGELYITKSCTETLQTFQRPRVLHSGSPVKAENLGTFFHLGS